MDCYGSCCWGLPCVLAVVTSVVVEPLFTTVVPVVFPAVVEDVPAMDCYGRCCWGLPCVLAVVTSVVVEVIFTTVAPVAFTAAVETAATVVVPAMRKTITAAVVAKVVLAVITAGLHDVVPTGAAAAVCAIGAAAMAGLFNTVVSLLYFQVWSLLLSLARGSCCGNDEFCSCGSCSSCCPICGCDCGPCFAGSYCCCCTPCNVAAVVTETVAVVRSVMTIGEAAIVAAAIAII
ncbi:hypothetical protein NDU88_011377 [Pleurodeles waltl]|uniref:Uncharacterized protein n=1 Tax=Pleurodeles waltl TaxID=8319 RepID=A0AAV7S579_PLEWA|nr:hypothetical protein NDU88_011377 [Pleurodeles waltl]